MNLQGPLISVQSETDSHNSLLPTEGNDCQQQRRGFLKLSYFKTHNLVSWWLNSGLQDDLKGIVQCLSYSLPGT